MSKRSRNDAEEAKKNPPPVAPAVLAAYGLQRVLAARRKNGFADPTTVADAIREKAAILASETTRQRYAREDREARQAAARERIRNMKMPAHPEPCPKDDYPQQRVTPGSWNKDPFRYRRHKKHRGREFDEE